MRSDAIREAAQWFALLGAAAVWAGQFVTGMGLGLANCSVAGRQWNVDQGLWETVLTASAAFVAVLAEAVAIWLYVDLRGASDDPPDGRRRFFAFTAIIANVLFLTIILFSGIMSLYKLPCTQA